MTKRSPAVATYVSFTTTEEYVTFVGDKKALDELAMTVGRLMYEGKPSKRTYSSWPPSFDGIDRYEPEGVYLYETGMSYGDGYTERDEYLVPVDCLLHPEKYEEEWAQEAKVKASERDAQQRENKRKQYLALKKEFGDS